jgi:hypothetical protein
VGSRYVGGSKDQCGVSQFGFTCIEKTSLQRYLYIKHISYYPSIFLLLNLYDLYVDQMNLD